MAIPKIIHYVWFGPKEKPALVQKCLQSWQKIMPDYQIIEWNETNFPLSDFTFAQSAWEMKKYAFASDVARLYALQTMGGIYLDTDVETLKSFDQLLNQDMFIGFENPKLIGSGIIGSIPQHPTIIKLLDFYQGKIFDKNKISTNTEIMTQLFVQQGLKLDNTLQEVQQVNFYPSDYFSPLTLFRNYPKVTTNTYTIHWYQGSWNSPKQKLLNKINKIVFAILIKIFGPEKTLRWKNWLKQKIQKS